MLLYGLTQPPLALALPAGVTPGVGVVGVILQSTSSEPLASYWGCTLERTWRPTSSATTSVGITTIQRRSTIRTRVRRSTRVLRSAGGLWAEIRKMSAAACDRPEQPTTLA